MEDLSLSEALLAELVATTEINDLTTVRGQEVSQLIMVCVTGNVDYVEALLEAPGIRVDLQNHVGTHALMFACAGGHTEIAQLLLNSCQNPSHLVNLPDKQGTTAIIVASQYGHTETVSLLLQNGAHINMQDNKGWSSLIIASQHGHTKIVSLLLQNGAHVNMQNNEGVSSMIIASKKGHTETVSLLLQNDAHVNMQNNEALMIASQNGHTKTVSLLLQNGAHVNMQNNEGWSSLIIASQHGHTKIVSLLLQNGAHVYMRNNEGVSSLIIASQRGHTETVSLLLQNGAHVNMQNNKGRTALMASCFYSTPNYMKISQLLIARGADMNTQTTTGHTALMIAIRKKNIETALHLIACSAELNISDFKGYSALTLATKLNQMLVVEQMITSSQGVVIDYQDPSGYTSLTIASSRGYTEIVKVLLKAGANVNFSNFSDYPSLHLPLHDIGLPADAELSTIRGTALDIAVIRGQVEMVSLLLQHGAKIHNIFYLLRGITLAQAKANVEKDATSLTHMIAPTTNTTSSSDSAWERYSTIIGLLFSCNSDLIERVQCTKPSCLYTACAFGVLELVSLLLDLGTDVSDLFRTEDDKSTYWSRLVTIICSGSLLSSVASKATTSSDVADILCRVNWHKYARIISLLIEYGLDINHQDSSGSSALSIACGEGHTDLVKLLLHTGRADVNLQDKEGISSLMQASSGGHLETCRCLLHYCAKVDLQDKKGWSALMLAVAHGDVSLIVLLIERGAQVNLQDLTGISSLMLSSFAGQTDVVRVLLNHGAEVNLQNNDGITALMMSSYSGHTEIVELLLQHGADVHTETHIGITALRFSSNTDITELLRHHGATDHQQRRRKRTLSDRAPTVSSTHFITYFRSIPKQDISLERLEEILQTLSQNTAIPKLSMKPTLAESYKTLLPIAYSWKNIGLFLGLDNDELKIIEYDNRHCRDCLREMLHRWLKRVIPPPMWEELAEAVEDAQHQDIAHKIRKSHD